ncbi:MAG: DUF899 family protein [Rhodobacter sp.]|nr:DUF899 family protein [Rhodobacter sp.]
MSTITTDRAEWEAARLELLAREKAHTRDRDALAAARRTLPRLKIESSYSFEGPEGPVSLGDLFDGRSQLMLYHFMYGEDWAEGCPSCSFWADNLDGIDLHLAHRDVSFAMVSSAPFATIDAYRRRMGWRFRWFGGAGAFNRDMQVRFTQDELDSGAVRYNFGTGGFPSTEAPGLTCFETDGDGIYLTYATYARGLDWFNGAYQLLDLAPKGRDEGDLPWPMAWLRRHDQYDA